MTVIVNGTKSDQLTTGVDIAKVEGTGKDKIYAAFVSDGVAGSGSTLNPGDTIVGNGKTVLNLTVAAASAGPTNLPGMSVSGLKTLNIKDLNDGAARIDLVANNWGSSVETIGLYGSEGLELHVSSLTVGSKLVATASGANQDIDVTEATFGNATLTVDVENFTDDATAAKAVIKSDSILATSGVGDKVDVTYTHNGGSALAISSVTADSAAILTQGSHVNVVLGGLTSGVVGDVTIGAMKASGSTAEVNLDTSVNGSLGTVTVGKTTIDSLELAGISSADVDSSITLAATNTLGNATIGNLVIKDVTMMSAYNLASSELVIDVAASAGGADGVATVGRLNLAGGIDASAAVGDVSVDIGLDASGGATAASSEIKAVKIGDVGGVTPYGSSDFVFDANATNGKIGNVAFGNVSFQGYTAGTHSAFAVTIGADNSLGNLTFGDLSVDASHDLAGNAEVDDFYIEAEADTVGNVKLGDIDVTSDGAVNANVGWTGVHVTSNNATTATAGVGTVTVGDVNLDASEGSGSFNAVDLHVTSVKDVGATVIGDIDVSAGSVTSGRDAEFNVDLRSTGGALGTVELGDVNLLATNATSHAKLDVNLVGGTTTGALTIGAIDLFGQTGSGTASLIVDVTSTGNITAGKITVGENVVGGTGADADVTFALTGDGAITLGNVVVTGDASTSNFETLDYNDTANSWLDADVTGTGDVTIGNVNYSGFDGNATIDVNGWVGAKTIWGASGDNIIIGNSGQNTIHLAAGAGADTIRIEEVQLNGTALVGSDYVKGFESGTDGFNINTASGAGTAVVAAGTFDTYAAFLAYAATNTDTVYAAKIAGSDDYFVIVDADGTGTADYVYRVDGSLASGDFSFH